MNEIVDFTEFIFKRVYRNNFYKIDRNILLKAFDYTVEDVRYRREAGLEDIFKKIVTNYNELGIYLYRLGRLLYEEGYSEDLLMNIHWLMKDLCSMEVFFSTEIGVGYGVSHGEGSIIGPRHTIGKGFLIHQGCTVGKNRSIEDKVVIGNDVTMYANSMILGNVYIENNTIVPAGKIIKK